MSTQIHALTPRPNTNIAYTDGACRGNPGKGGYGAVIILSTGEKIDISGGDTHTTNNKMELMGALAALQHSPSDQPLQIWTDSSYVKNGITEWIIGWKKKQWKNVKNVELWQQLDAACQQREVTWHWVKGHAGHAGNEYADRLANQGIDNLPKTFTKKTSHTVTAVINSLPTDENNLPKSSVTMTSFQDDKKKADAMNPNSLVNQPAMTQNSPNADQTSDTYEPLETLFFTDGDGYLEEQTLDNQTMPDNLDMSVEMSRTTALNQSNNYRASVNEYAGSFAAFMDANGNFIAQDEGLIAQRPDFNGVTDQANPSFIPLLPHAKHKKVSNRQLILDTETTGFDAQNGDRIIEVGIVELINRRFTGEKLHVYINPQRQMDDEVIRVHGIHNVFLADMPVFSQVGHVVYEFLLGAELIAHNASFDMNFLQAEFSRLGLPDITTQVTVTDSLAIAKQLYAGQRNTLDALVKRLNVGKQDRTFHGALLDAEILAEVYLAMTGGQVALAIDEEMGQGLGSTREHTRFSSPVKRFVANSQAEAAHLAWLQALQASHPLLAEHWDTATANDGLIS